MTPLRDHLLDAYGGFADRRFKDRDLDRTIKVDDRGPRDVYPYFCSIFASVPDRNGDALRMTIQHAPSRPGGRRRGRDARRDRPIRATSAPPSP